MEIPFESWYKAIFIRRSRRIYKKIGVPPDKLDRLVSICRNFRAFPEARAVLVDQPSEHIYRGFMGSYGKITDAPGYIAFIGNMDSSRVQEAVGFTGQGIILEATSLGLGTCWVGGYFRPEEAHRQIPLAREERVLAITPFGFPRDSYSAQEKLMIGLARLHKRKSLKELVTGTPDKEWMKTALEAARLAPSAVNRQPWRFVCGDTSISVSLDKKRDTYKISRRLDCGIAMLHLELGARHAGVSGHWTFPPDRVARFWADSGS